jgi:transcriptional regulator with PAS, ATPase and Fis domain
MQNRIKMHQENTMFSSLQVLPTIKQMEDCLINEALMRTRTLTEASRKLGISRQTLSKRIKHF